MDGRLKLWEPTDQPVRRCLWLSREVRNAIAEFNKDAPSSRIMALIDDLDQFAAGRLITVGPQGYLKRLRPPPATDDWNLRSLVVPHFRVLGAFARPDNFVALYGAPRSRFDTKGWPNSRREAEENWQRLFPGQPRHVGTLIGDVITEKTLPNGSEPIPF